MNKQLIKEIFYFFTALLVAFCALEIIFPNIVLAYLNINYLFLLWLITGLIILTKK